MSSHFGLGVVQCLMPHFNNICDKFVVAQALTNTILLYQTNCRGYFNSLKSLEAGFRDLLLSSMLTITPSCRPLPETQWSKKNGLLPFDRVEYANYGKSLVIRYADFQDSGQYECEATNGVGTAATYSMEVEVQGTATACSCAALVVTVALC